MARINQLVNNDTLNATDVLAKDAASGGTTNKITAANLASGIKTIGSLVNTTEMNAAIAQSTACKYLNDVSKTVIQLLDGDYGNLTDGEFKEYRIRASDSTVIGFIVRHTQSYAAGILCTFNPGVVFHAVKRSASGSFELMQI